MKAKHIAAATLIVAPIVAQANDLPVSISVDVPFYSKYVWRGINLVNDPVLQPSVTLGYENWSLNLWGNYDIDNAKRFNEYDVTLNYSRAFGQGTWNLGYIDYAFPGANPGHTREIYGRVDFNQEFAPYFAINFDVDEADGFYARIGGSTDFSTAAGDINFHGWFGYGSDKHNNFYYGNNKGGLADFGVEATWSRSLSENTTGYVKLGYTALLDKNHLNGAPNRNNFIFGFGVNFGL